MIREAFAAALLRAAAFADRVNQLNPIHVDDAELRRGSQEDLRPALAALVMISFTYMRSEADCVWRALPRASEAADRRAGEETRRLTLLAIIDFYLSWLLITPSCHLRGSFLTCWSEA
jgi:hypothetical protein